MSQHDGIWYASWRNDLHSALAQHSFGGGITPSAPIRAIGDFCAAKVSAQVHAPAAPLFANSVPPIWSPAAPLAATIEHVPHRYIAQQRDSAALTEFLESLGHSRNGTRFGEFGNRMRGMNNSDVVKSFALPRMGGAHRDRIAIISMPSWRVAPLEIRLPPHHQDSALYPIITQLEQDAGFRREDTDEQRLDKLKAVEGDLVAGAPARPFSGRTRKSNHNNYEKNICPLLRKSALRVSAFRGTSLQQLVDRFSEIPDNARES